MKKMRQVHILILLDAIQQISSTLYKTRYCKVGLITFCNEINDEVYDSMHRPGLGCGPII